MRDKALIRTKVRYTDSYLSQVEREIGEVSSMPADDVRQKIMLSIVHQANREKHERWLTRQS